MHSIVRSAGLIAVVLTVLVSAVGLADRADAQNVDTDPTLGIELTSTQPTHYVDADGHTVIVGEVANLTDFPVTDVRVWAGFYADGLATPLESHIGSTLLDVITPRGTSPYVIRSPSPDLDVIGVSVNLLGFTSSSAKPQNLAVSDPDVSVAGRLDVHGTIEYVGDGGSLTNPFVYALVYDSFVPPRLLGVHDTELVLMGTGDSFDYDFSLEYGEEAALVRVIAKSDNYASNVAETSVVRAPTSPLSISTIAAVDSTGTPVSTLREGAASYIRSAISGSGAGGTEYEYIVQVTRFGHLPVVEFVGSTSGVITAAGLAQPLVEWIPASDGLFYIETYLWSASDVPLAPPGPLTLVNVEPRL